MVSPAKILVVEDEPLVSDVFAKLLRAAGYEVACVPNPSAALQRAAAERYDVVLLDNRFKDSPEVGIAAVHDFSRMSSAGVIMITGYGDDDLERDARLLGAQAFLNKPVNPEVLLDAVAGVLAGRKP